MLLSQESRHRLSDMKGLPQGYSAKKQQSKDLNPGLSDSRPVLGVARLPAPHLPSQLLVPPDPRVSCMTAHSDFVPLSPLSIHI